MFGQSYDIFISYKSEDLLLAERLNDRLVTSGFRVWFDKARLRPGFRWHEEIELGCENSRVVLPVLTPRWRLSEWTKYETYGAEAVIPLHFEGRWEDVATAPLLRYQNAAIDFRPDSDLGWAELDSAIHQLLGRSPLRKEERLVNLRYRANPHFTGRENELNQMNEILHRGPATGLTGGAVFAITALGGTGKTTLARQYVEKFWRLYPQIFWVDARQDPIPGFASIGRSLFPTLASLGDDVLARRALQELEGRQERLLIIDDVQEEESIQDWIPKIGNCHTIITSRFASWSAAVENIPLHLLDPEPSRDLMIGRAGLPDTEENRETAARLAARLEYLPLALEQAASYIRREGPGFGFLDYLAVFDRASGELLERRVPGATEYPNSVVTTWKTTVARLSWNARAVLRIASHLAPVSVPKSMVTGSADLILALARFLEVMATGLADFPGNAGSAELVIKNALQELAAYSMISSHGHDFRVHSLVQTVERICAPDSEHSRFLVGSLEVVSRSRPEDLHRHDDWPIWQIWSDHARTTLKYAEDASLNGRPSELLSWVGLWLEKTADYREAEAYLRKALAESEIENGKNSLDVAARLNNLAGLLRTRGSRGEAEEKFQRAKSIVEGALGPDHGLVVGIAGNLGLVFQDSGRLGDAESMFQRAVDIERRRDLLDPCALAVALTNLAGALSARNQFAQAEDLYRQALLLDEESRGPDGPDVAKSLLNLAGVLRETRRLEEAEHLCRRALSITEKAYGPDHPEVGTCLNSLAQVCEYQNRCSEAEELLDRALAIDLAVFGPDHEKVAVRLNNLAGLMRKTGRLEDAENAMRRSLNIRDTALGPSHLMTVHMCGRLADVLRRSGKLEEAEALARRAVKGWADSELPRSYKAGRALRILARVLRDSGRISEAVDSMTAAVAIFEETLVPGDPRIAGALEELEAIRIFPGDQSPEDCPDD